MSAPAAAGSPTENTITETAAPAPAAEATEAAPAAPAPAEVAAPVAPTVTEDLNAKKLLPQLLEMVRSGKWSAAVGIFIMLLVAGIRGYGRKLLPWLGTQLGGYVLAFLTATGAVMGAALAAGMSFSFSLLGNSITVGLAAIGAHQAFKDAKKNRAKKKAAKAAAKEEKEEAEPPTPITGA